MKRYLLATLTCYMIMMGIYLYKVYETYSDLKNVQGESAPAVSIDENSPLVTNKYIDALPFASLKTKAETMRHHYNRTHHMCQAVRSHLSMMRSTGFVSKNVEEAVLQNLSSHERLNQKLKQQYDSIVAFAEKQYAEGMIRSHSEDMEDQARLLDKQNEVLLKNVDLPVSFQ